MELVLFDLFTVLLIAADMSNYGKQITPLTILGGVYTALINLNNLVLHRVYSFVLVDSKALWVIFSFYIVIFLVDFLGGQLYRRSKHCDFSYSIRFKSYGAVTGLFIVGVAAYSLQFILLYHSYGLNNIKGKNGGILGHLTSLAFILGPVALDLALKTKRKLKIILAGGLNLAVLAINVAFGGKYVIFINLTYFLLYFILKRNKRANLMKMIKIVFPLAMIAVAAFVILYYVIPRATGHYQSTLDFAIKHMFYYLVGSITANNYTMLHAGQGDVLTPFTVIANIAKALVGNHEYVNPIYPFVFPVDSVTYTNVSGFLGETVYDLGIMGAYLYTAFIFGIVNFFYYQYRNNNKFYLAFCYSNAITAFLFFCNFYSVSGIVLPLMLAIALDVFSFFRVGKFHI